VRRHTVAAVSAAGLLLAGGGVAAASTALGTPTAHGTPGRASHAADGRVTGKFEREGGPPEPSGKQPVVPLSGTMRFARAGHRTVRVHVGKSGKFSVRLAPGSYRVSGRTPQILQVPGNIEATCWLHGRLKVSSGRTRHIVVTCIVP
jgi:hypothetical protein